MISPESLFHSLKRHGVGIFAGVPDSLLKSFCAYVDDHAGPGEHIIAANEGNAVAIVAGFHLATGRVGAVYMQNSGLGNAINPLTSIADAEVYGIPMLLIVGWRGEPSVPDEPQHKKQGRITLAQLDLLELPYWILEADSDSEQILGDAFGALHRTNSPVALVVRKGAFSSYKSQPNSAQTLKLTREDALRQLLELAGPDALVVSTTGKTSREVFELRVERGERQQDFLIVGGMGHAASIALGVAVGVPQKRVICLDGDGSLLMHLGAMPITGNLGRLNLLHVLLNNSAHESVGGQPTVAGKMDFAAISRASGYRDYQLATDAATLTSSWHKLIRQAGPTLLEVKISIGSRDNLGRPTSTPEKNKQAFMEHARA